MSTTRKFYKFWYILFLLLMIGLPGCSQVITSSNYTLGSGQTVSGGLMILSGNVDLQERSLVTGPVIQVCCDLTVNGKVGGGIQMLTGNILLGPEAQVGKDIHLVTGDFMRSPGSQVGGQVTNGPTTGDLLGMGLVACLTPVVLLGLIVFLLYNLLRLLKRRSGQPQNRTA